MNKAEQKYRVRNRPTQKRAQETYELILTTTAELLEEVGFDKLNTNLICKRAGLTPPALYRYFPNKYSILEQLGERLMDAQNSVSIKWMELHQDAAITFEHLLENLREQFNVTKKFAGAKWIMRSLRSVPTLSEVRTNSHERMNALFTEWYLRKYPHIDELIIARRVRITNEAGYAIFEMLMDGDFGQVDEILRDTAIMMDAFSNDGEQV